MDPFSPEISDEERSSQKGPPGAGLRRRWAGPVVILFSVVAVALLGGMWVSSSVESWYPHLRKPSWTPASWLFAPAWTGLYLLITISGILVYWKQNCRPSLHLRLIFFLQLLLNLLWPALFFGLKRPGWACLENLLLVACVALLMRVFWPVSRTASLLLLPYLLWVGFAALLTGAVWRLN